MQTINVRVISGPHFAVPITALAISNEEITKVLKAELLKRGFSYAVIRSLGPGNRATVVVPGLAERKPSPTTKPTKWITLKDRLATYE